MSADAFSRAAVLGAGAMGAGIAQAGLAVRMSDVNAERAEAGRERIATGLAGLVAKGKMADAERAEILGRIATAESPEQACEAADLVIEAAPEDLDLKRSLFTRVSSAAPSSALLATNTSSLPVTRIAEAASDPSRFLGLHFFNPPPIMKLLEIVRARDTSDESVATAIALAKRLGKEPIVVKDSPGFASSRLGLVLGLEAMRMLEEGVASAADIDTAMKLGYRHPMGPLELTDLVGLDVRLAIAEHLARELSDARFAPPEILKRLVAEGHLGRKTGRGFHRWRDGAIVPE